MNPKKILTLLPVVFLFAALMTACKKDAMFYSTFVISSGEAQFEGNTLVFEWERQTSAFDVISGDASGRWNAYVPSGELWCTLFREGNKLSVTVSENNSPTERSTYIMLSHGEERRRINVVQRSERHLNFARKIDLVVSAATHDNLSLALETTILPQNLTASANVDWITSLRIDSNNVVFNATRNTSTSTRQATITVSGDHRTASIAVVQEPVGVIAGSATNICPDTAVLLTIELPESTASVQWYRNNILIAGATNTTYRATQNGSYTVSYGGTTSPEKQIMLTRCLVPDALTYEDFLGTYTMWYHASTGTPLPGANGAPRQHSAVVRLEEAVWGSTYHLKGLLTSADEARGPITVHYNATARRIEIRGQQLFVRTGDTIFYLIPEANAGDSYTVTAPTNASFTVRGVASAEYDVRNEVLRFELRNIEGTWGTSNCSGFRLRDYQGGTNLGDVNGIIGRARFHHTYFVKQ